MKVQFIFADFYPNLKDLWIGAVTTDDPDKFREWLDTMMPDHKVVAYRRSSNATEKNGGYHYRINVHCKNTNQQMIFKLAWK